VTVLANGGATRFRNKDGREIVFLRRSSVCSRSVRRTRLHGERRQFLTFISKRGRVWVPGRDDHKIYILTLILPNKLELGLWTQGRRPPPSMRGSSPSATPPPMEGRRIWHCFAVFGVLLHPGSGVGIRQGLVPLPGFCPHSLRLFGSEAVIGSVVFASARISHP